MYMESAHTNTNIRMSFTEVATMAGTFLNSHLQSNTLNCITGANNANYWLISRDLPQYNTTTVHCDYLSNIYPTKVKLTLAIRNKCLKNECRLLRLRASTNRTCTTHSTHYAQPCYGDSDNITNIAADWQHHLSE